MLDTLNPDELPFLLSCSARKLCQSPELTEFLVWISQTGPALAPNMASQIDSAAGPAEHFFKAIGLQIYHSTPLPAYDLSLPPASRPGRNAPCFCGSGRKYKHCCQQLEMPPLLENYNMLRHVLDHYSQKDLAALPNTQADPLAIADTAEQLLKEGNPKRAIALLEPWFKANVKLGKHHAALFQPLMALYLDQQHPVKRKRLLERVCNSEDRTLKSSGYQSRASIELDNGNIDDAWHYFTQAQQLTPNHPDLALLEIILHCSQGNETHAKSRARFWLARLQQNHNTSPELLELLAQCTEDPLGAIFDTLPSQPDSPIHTLLTLLSEAPNPGAVYTLDVYNENDNIEAALRPKPKQARAENLWRQTASSNKPSLTYLQADNHGLWEAAENWLPLLQQHPILLDSFTVLDDLVLATDTLLECAPEIEARPLLLLQQTLLERAHTLLETQLQRHKGSKALQLPWAILENRPALRLLAQRASMLDALDDEPYEAYRAQLEQLIALNPNDNHGIRAELSTLCLAIGDPQRAIELSDAYPEDMLCPLPLNQVLAMYMTGHAGQALGQLTKVAERFPVALKMLLAKSPRQPTFSEHGVSLGGKEEAWLYRESTLHLWQQSGALTWLQQAMKALDRK